jgi:ATP-dependent exoDNAse (exonuclease V) alpha subunit
LAIYHLTVKVLSRARGQSVVAAAAYRLGTTLRDERYGGTHNYTNKRDVAHAEILAPVGAPDWVYDRAALWNRVEAGERRKDAQLARVIEVGLPIELSHDESVALVRDYIVQEFVAKGMIADFGIRRIDPNNPHAHILLTLREALGPGFGPKVRKWNAKSNLLDWRSAWAERVNQHLARAGHAVRIDHRTLEAQQIELTPTSKAGVGRGRQGERTLPSHLAERIAAQQRIAKENGEAIVEDPTVALRAITRQRPTFTQRDLAKFLQSRTDGAAQLDAALLAITKSSELVPLRADDGEEARFTTRDLLEAQKSLMRRSASMASRRGHGVASEHQSAVQTRFSLTAEQLALFEYLAGEGDIKAIVSVGLGVDVGAAGGDMSAVLAAARSGGGSTTLDGVGSGAGAVLAAARQAWEAQGFRVMGAALSKRATLSLEASADIASRTLESHEYEWKEGRDILTRNDVFVVAESEMIGIKQLERLLAAVDKARAKIVLVGDAEQLRAIGEAAPFRGLVRQTSMANADG